MSCFDFGLLNREQKEAVLCTEGPVLIIAGPGTGKTFTLVKRISYLIREKGITPGQIMVVTFTEKAGRELLTRISNELIDLNLNINEMYIGTFHAVCLRLLKENLAYAGSNGGRDHMLDAFEQTYLVCRNIEYFNRLGGYSKYIPVKSTWKQAQEICRLVNQLMEEMVDIDAMLDDFDEDMRFLAKLVKSYLDLLEKNTMRCTVKSKTARKNAVELNVEIRLRDGNTDFVNELADLSGVSSAVLVSYNGDYMG